MKRLFIFIALAALVLASCHSGKVKEFKTDTISGEQCYLLIFDEALGPWGNTVGVTNSYSVVWPDDGMMSRQAKRQLMSLYFGDSTTTDPVKGAKHWLEQLDYFADEPACVRKPVESIDDSVVALSYANLKSYCRQDSNLVTFVVNSESYNVGAAHGLYAAQYLTFDVQTGNVVRLSDLVDTSLLGEAIAHAVQDLEVNRDVRECLFDEFRDVDRMPVPHDFFIDSTRSTITVVYPLYEVACYACGIQSVVLPIFWLSKHTPLTPYAKRLFGPGSSL